MQSEIYDILLYEKSSRYKTNEHYQILARCYLCLRLHEKAIVLCASNSSIQ